MIGVLEEGGPDRVTGLHDIAAPEADRVHADGAGEFVHGRFDRKAGLAQSIAAKGTGRQRIRVDDAAIDFFVGAAIDADRFVAGVIEDRRPMIAVRAGVREDLDAECGQRAVPSGASAYADAHGVTRRRRGELFLPRPVRV